MQLQLEDLTGKESSQIPLFNHRLLELLPGLAEHHCAEGKPGGFVERLGGGTYFGHIVEHVAIELSQHVSIGANYGKTISADEPGHYNIIVEYKAEQGMRYLLTAAVELVEALVAGDQFPLEERLSEARRVVVKSEPGPSTRAIIEAAARRDIPWMRVSDRSLVQLGYGKNRKFIQAAMSSDTSVIGADIASDKELTKRILEQSSIPVPVSCRVSTESDAIAAFNRIGPPVVVKPLNGNQGKGVSLRLNVEEQVIEAFKIAREYSAAALVEEMIEGRDYRVLVVAGEVVAASERRACHVVGDGVSTIRELIEIENSNPLRGDEHEKPLTRISIDPTLLLCLAKAGLTLASIPRPGQVVYMRECANLSTGGTATDVTDLIHPDIKSMCERAALAVGLDICGVDLIAEDISLPARASRSHVIELNASPGLRMHLWPSEGEQRDIGTKIVEMLYPKGAAARIPIISVTGTNGKTTVTRMIAHVISESGQNVGMTTTDGIFIGGRCVYEGDTTGPQSARTVLSDPSVEVAVLETARGGIARRGLGYDWSDISVLTNIGPDHIGQDGIRSIEDILHIKSLVAERVRRGGALVLNADDEQLARLMYKRRIKRVSRNVIYFSLSENHLLVKRHLSAGGTAYFIRGGWIIEATQRREYQVAHVASLPVTMMGLARFQLANSLAAVAACRAYGLTREQVSHALRRFTSDRHNPGRVNLYGVGGGYVMIDYGHNPDAFEAIGRVASSWDGLTVTGIIGVPGDRGDSLIAQAGRKAAMAFHRIIIKEDKDLRGRAPGEVAELLRRAIQDEAPALACDIISDECEALRQEIRRIGYNDLIVLFYEKLEPVREVLDKMGAVPISHIESLSLQVSQANV
jgi:cyanophycin synthetase